MLNNITFILPCGGCGSRMMHQLKALIKLNNEESIIQRQIRLIRSIYPNCEIIVVGGFKFNKLEKIAKKLQVRLIENKDYANTNVAHSIKLGVNSATNEKIIVVYGDLVFNREALLHIDFTKSCVLLDTLQTFKKDEVGLCFNNESYVSHFSYGLDKKWAQVVYLTGKEKKLFSDEINNPDSSRAFGYEILNKVIDKGGEFRAMYSSGILVEVDGHKDLEKANNFIRI